MTPEQQKTKEQAEVMLDFANGKTVERCPRDGNGVWAVVTVPTWDWLHHEYRTKHAPKRCQTRYYPQREDKWGASWGMDRSLEEVASEEILQMIELTPEVIKALEAAGIQWS